MYNLLLIHPFSKNTIIGYGNTKNLGIPPLSLAYIAALTPDDWNIKIIDECIEPIEYDKTYDLIGITTSTYNINRAYNISSEFRKKGIKVVLGGIHVSTLPQEALQFSDAVVIGEAELIWEKVLEDCKNGKLNGIYKGVKPNLKDVPMPRRDLLSKKYAMTTIQMSRGCPFECEFCSVKNYFGSEYRQRPIEDIIKEIKSIKNKIIYIIDDNFYGSGIKARERSLSLFKAIIENNIKKFS